MACLLALIGAWAISREAARFPEEANLGAGIQVMTYVLPVLGLAALSLLFWVLGLTNLAYRRLLGQKETPTKP